MGSGVGAGRGTIQPMALTKMKYRILKKYDSCRMGGHLFVMLLWSFWQRPAFWIQTVWMLVPALPLHTCLTLVFPLSLSFPHLQHDDHKDLILEILSGLWQDAWPSDRNCRRNANSLLPLTFGSLSLFLGQVAYLICLGFP